MLRAAGIGVVIRWKNLCGVCAQLKAFVRNGGYSHDGLRSRSRQSEERGNNQMRRRAVRGAGCTDNAPNTYLMQEQSGATDKCEMRSRTASGKARRCICRTEHSKILKEWMREACCPVKQ